MELAYPDLLWGVRLSVGLWFSFVIKISVSSVPHKQPQKHISEVLILLLIRDCVPGSVLCPSLEEAGGIMVL